MSNKGSPWLMHNFRKLNEDPGDASTAMERILRNDVCDILCCRGVNIFFFTGIIMNDNVVAIKTGSSKRFCT